MSADANHRVRTAHHFIAKFRLIHQNHHQLIRLTNRVYKAHFYNIYEMWNISNQPHC